MPVLREKDAVEARKLGEAHRELGLPLVVIEVRRVDERAALVGDSVDDRRMVIAERVDADAAEQIEIAIAVLVDDVHTFAADKKNRAAIVRGKQQAGLRGANLFEFHLSRTSSGNHDLGAVGYA